MSNNERLACVADEVTESTCMLPGDNPFKIERTKQANYYPPDWHIPSLEEQQEQLAQHIAGVNLSLPPKHINGITMPTGADGIALIPKISFLGNLWSIDDPYGNGYWKVVTKVLELIANSRRLRIAGRMIFNEDYLRIHSDTKELLLRAETRTDEDALVLPINFGDLYAGYSPRNARWEALNSSQLPLCLAQVGFLLLTMPVRIDDYNNLFVDCPGDEYNTDSDGEWSYCPYLCYCGCIDLSVGCNTDDCESYGSAVAFLGS